MPVHGSHATRLIVSRDDVKDSAANSRRSERLRKNPSIEGAWLSFEIHKNFKQAIRLDSIKHRKLTFGAIPQQQHVMHCGRLANAPIHGNLFVDSPDNTYLYRIL